MSDFKSVYPENNLLDPNKRVNYIHGLVLGVDEFKQEEHYLLEKDKLHNRTLHGYGTACGLKVSQEEVDTGLEVRVDPGIAVSPSGQVIEVPRTQCAIFDEWLASHTEDVAEALGSPAVGPLSVYLMLCYRECKTDLVPIPTGPCQSLEDTSAPSRIADDFSLSFELNAPSDEHFESPMQQFSELLMSIPVEAAGTMTLEDIQALVRTLIPHGSPASPPMVPGSPATIEAIAPENIEQFFNAAFLVWVTEVKPCLMSSEIEQVPSDPYQHCVFLAQLNIDIEIIEGIARLDGDLEIDEQFRQFLLSTQGLQNYLGPLSHVVASQVGLTPPLVEPPTEPIADVMSLSNDQVVTGSKTFNAPVILGAEGRVRKNIILPANRAFRGRGVAETVFNNVVPSIRFSTTGTNAFNGTALFDLPIPDDMSLTNRFQFRLMWGFQGASASTEVNFNWVVAAQTFAEGEAVAESSLQEVRLTISSPARARNNLNVTDFRGFASGVRLNQRSRQGTIRIGIERTATGSLPAISLMQLELQYVANRLGRGM